MTMAGDLFIENITTDQCKMLTEAGGEAGEIIFHSDREFNDYESVLRAQLVDGAVTTRHHLPAHSYVTFKASKRDTLSAYASNKMQALRLDDFLKKCSRPLGLVSNKASLAGWPGATALSATTIFVAAVTQGNVIIEYYKFDGRTLLYPGYRETWQKVPE
jgi:hypothetical protein